MKQCPHCKQFILTPREKELVEFIRRTDGATFVGEVAARFKITISNASNALKKLSDFGFAWREPMTARSGGIEYAYYRVKAKK